MQCAYRQFEIALGNDRLYVGLPGNLLETCQRHASFMQRTEGARSDTRHIDVGADYLNDCNPADRNLRAPECAFYIGGGALQ